MSQRRLAAFCRQELVYFGKFQRKLAFVNHVRHAVLVIYRERFAPVALTGEDGITQTEVHLHASQVVFLHIFLGSSNSFLDGQSVQTQVAIRSYTGFRRVADNSFLRIEAFFADITSFYQRHDGQIEMLGKSIVTTIMSRYGHDRSRTISGQYIIADPYRNRFSGKRIHGIRTAEYTCHTAVGNTFTFGTFLGTFQVSFHLCTLCISCQLRNQFTFRCKYHEGHTEHRIGTGSKDSKFQIAVFHLETDFSTF